MLKNRFRNIAIGIYCLLSAALLVFIYYGTDASADAEKRIKSNSSGRTGVYNEEFISEGFINDNFINEKIINKADGRKVVVIFLCRSCSRCKQFLKDLYKGINLFKNSEVHLFFHKSIQERADTKDPSASLFKGEIFAKKGLTETAHLAEKTGLRDSHAVLVFDYRLRLKQKITKDVSVKNLVKIISD
ncbi:MAG: hypothetical protein ACM34K_10870 [Bacillota bacterium]